MIRQLMKRDPAWPSVPGFTLASGVFCVLWHFLTAKADLSSNLIFISVFGALPFTAGVLAATQQGDTLFQTALPVTVRQVYLARVLSMIGLLWLPAAVSVVIALALPNPAVPVATLVEFLSVWTLAMLGMQSAGIRGFTVPSRWIAGLGFFLWMFGASVSPIWGRLSGENTIGFILLPPICWLASAAIFLRTWHTLPESFQTAPLKASPVAISGGTAPSRWIPTIPWIPVMRTVLRWGGLEVVFLFVLMATGSLRPVLPLYFASVWPSARPQVRWLFALPVHRRALLAVILLPIILTLTGGYLVGVHLPFFPAPYARGISVRASQAMPEWVRYRQDSNCKTLNVLPSVDFWALANRGKAPVIQAPWGETFQPPVFRNSGFDIFNPYAAGCENSERFLDWQFSRATTAVYGRPLPRDKNAGWYAVYSHVVVTSLRTQFVTVAFITGLAMLATIVTLLNNWHRFRRLAASARVTIFSLAGAAGFALVMLDSSNIFILSQWVSWALPQSFAGAAAVAIPSLAILYWVLDALFRRVEIVDKPEPSTT
jgi:hypothetical protein